MGCLYNNNTVGISPLFPKTVNNLNGHNFLSTCSFEWPISPNRKYPLYFASFSPSPFTVYCSGSTGDEPLSTSSAYSVLGVIPNCSPSDLKAAFRAKVKQFHPDVRRDGERSDAMIRRVIQAYEILSNYSKSEIIERECLDPFDEPECEAFDLFVNEVLCVGQARKTEYGVPVFFISLSKQVKAGCPFPCVKRAPDAFTFASSTGTARALGQDHGEDYQVQLAVGQCPRSCIHYVTPAQRVVLEELLDRFGCYTLQISFSAL
ncbi:unnamed protein product [Ilex paraguariensis]|uniref:J domain-containing protein n=1 Tax=Ilex paraguariensis TaxID=185542 RepID=A0ABC8TIU7_9AQUA